MSDESNAQSTGQAEQSMLLRTWPRTKVTVGTVVTAGTPVTADLSAVRGRTCFFKAVGGTIFGLTFQSGDAAPTLVGAEEFTIADGATEELYVWGDANLRLRMDSDTDGTKLVALYDETP